VMASWRFFFFPERPNMAFSLGMGGAWGLKRRFDAQGASPSG